MTTSPIAGPVCACPFCGVSSQYAFTAVDANQKVSSKPFHYFLCPGCGLTFIERPPEDLNRYYLNEQYDIPLDESGFDLRVQTQAWKVDLLKTIVSPGKLFEIGPATGEFAVAARKAGFTPTLAELDENCSRFLRDVLGLDVINTSVPSECLGGGERYDAICVWQAIEHIPEYWELLDRTIASLANNGVVVISTPNPEALQASLLGRFWPHIDAPRHLYLIPRGWFRSYARKHGLQVVLETTRDVGSTGLNYYGWYVALRNVTHGFIPDRITRMIARIFTRSVRHWEEAEGRGSSYTVVLRKS